MKYSYTGTMTAAKGLIYPLKNIPYKFFVRGGTTAETPPSTAALLAYSDDPIRPLDPVEIKWRPTAGSSRYRSPTDGCYYFNNGTAALTDGLPITAGTIGTGPEGVPDVMGIGFAFAGCDNWQNSLISLTKAYEWRPDIGSGFSSLPPRGVIS